MYEPVPQIILDKDLLEFSYWYVRRDSEQAALNAQKAAWRSYCRTKLSEQQNHKCCWCGIRMREDRGFDNTCTIEHIVPKSLGGKDDIDNFAAACRKCNDSRSNSYLVKFKDLAKPKEHPKKSRNPTKKNNISKNKKSIKRITQLFKQFIVNFLSKV